MLLYQRSINEQQLPMLWKTAHVIPVCKGKESKFDVSNYRPISLTSIFCKIMETVIRTSIFEHCKTNNILINEQHGFLPDHSTTTNLLEFINDISTTLDINGNIDAVCIDFAKAFDTVCHSKLLLKLEHYGIRGKVLGWIKNFLYNRSIKVLVNNTFSNKLPVPSSVPQGSVLAPILFILYINDIKDAIENCQFKLYADDLTIYRFIRNNNDVSLLQQDLHNILNWTNKWQLKINIEKCKVLHFGKNNLKHTYNINNNPITTSDCEKILGCLIDTNLTFKQHIFGIVKKAKNMCNQLLHTFYFCDRSVLVNLYKTYVRPSLEYASIIFSPHHLYLIDVLENVQKHFTKRLPGLKTVSYVDRLSFCKLESLELRRIYNDLIFMYKIMHNTVAVKLENCIIPADSHITRGNVLKLKKIRCNLNVRKFFFVFRTIDLWNKLHNDVVLARNVNIFITKLKSSGAIFSTKGRALLHA